MIPQVTRDCKPISSADNRLIDTMQTAREGSEIFVRKPEVRDPSGGRLGRCPAEWPSGHRAPD